MENLHVFGAQAIRTGLVNPAQLRSVFVIAASPIVTEPRTVEHYGSDILTEVCSYRAYGNQIRHVVFRH